MELAFLMAMNLGNFQQFLFLLLTTRYVW